MIKVLRHGAKFSVKNPITGAENTMINIVFVEEGRSGGDANMSGTSDFLSELMGQGVGLKNLRTHTQPVLEEKAGLFPVDKELPGFINRGIYSTPQLRQQVGIVPRMIDGQPTFFKTWIGNAPKDDEDRRIALNILAGASLNYVLGAQVGAAEVTNISLQEEVAAEEAVEELSE